MAVTKKKTPPSAPSFAPQSSPDEHAGRGGSYVIGADGKRVLQSRTKQHPDQPTQESLENVTA